MTKKKEHPLVVLQALQPYVNLKGDKFVMVNQSDYLLKLIDKDENSDFYFIIEQYRLGDDRKTYQVLLTRKPFTPNSIIEKKSWVEMDAIGSSLDKWINLLKAYDETHSFFDDPITETFKREYYADFEFVDDDVDVNSFNTMRILAIHDYLDDLHFKLDSYFDTKNGNESLREIQLDIRSLQAQLTTSTKRIVIDKIVKIWAKLAKQGVEYIKTFLIEAKKEVTKEIIKGIIDYTVKTGGNLLS